MNIKNIFTSLLLFILATPIYAIDEIITPTFLFVEKYFTMMSMAGISFLMTYLFIFLIQILFVLSQNKLIKSIYVENEYDSTSIFWTWSQLIPIWSLIAIPVSLVKLSKQYDTYLIDNRLTRQKKIVKYESLWGWVSFVFLLFSWLPYVFIFTIIFFIIYWVNVANTSKIVFHERDDDEELNKDYY